MEPEHEQKDPGQNGNLTELEIPDLKKLKSEDGKKRGLLGLLPGQAGAAGGAAVAQGGLKGLVQIILASKVASVGITLAVIGTTTVVIPAINRSMNAPSAAAKQKSAAVKPGELPSDKYANWQEQQSKGSSLEHLAQVSQGSGLNFNEDYMPDSIPNDPKGADALLAKEAAAAAGTDPAKAAEQAAADAAAAAKGAKPTDPSKMAEEMKKNLAGGKEGGLGAMGGGKLGNFGSGSGSFGGGGSGPAAKMPDYAPKAGFGKSGFGKGQKGKVEKMASAGMRADVNNLVKRPTGRSSKALAQLKLASKLSRQGAGAKSDTQAAAFATSAIEQQKISGGELIGGPGSGVGVQGGVGVQDGTVDPGKVGQDASGAGGGGMGACAEKASEIKCGAGEFLDFATCACTGGFKEKNPWGDKLKMARMLLMAAMATLTLVGLFADFAGALSNVVKAQTTVCAGLDAAMVAACTPVPVLVGCPAATTAAGLGHAKLTADIAAMAAAFAKATVTMALMIASAVAALAAIGIALGSGAPKDQTMPLILAGSVVTVGVGVAIASGFGYMGGTASGAGTIITATGVIAGLVQSIVPMLSKPKGGA